MFIEALHDQNGNILACYCSDTLPVAQGAPLVSYGEIPAGLSVARANIDTVTAMEIDAGSGPRAVVDPATGEPRIASMDRAEFVINSFLVDLLSEVAVPPGVSVPEGVTIRRLARKA